METGEIPVFGLGGDPLMAPDHSEVSFWSALAAGAEGVAVSVQCSADGVVVCATGEAVSGRPPIADMTWSELARQDAGERFCSRGLDENALPAGEQGQPGPWSAAHDEHRTLRVLRFDDMLAKFARRTRLLVLIPQHDNSLCEQTLSLLDRFGVSGRVVLIGNEETCRYLHSERPAVSLALNGLGSAPLTALETARGMGLYGMVVDWDAFDSDAAVAQLAAPELAIFTATAGPSFAPGGEQVARISQLAQPAGIITRGVMPTVERLTPPARVMSDSFAGSILNTERWSAGYSHINREAQIHQDDGLHIDLRQGWNYSGAAAICTLPLHGRFDVQVDFHVANPCRGTTFEMAAICVDPGYHHMDNSDLTSRSANLSFDVHGAPPYASSERAEDHGFRCGWNNSANITRIDTDWSASSVNMYNKYGRMVGDACRDNPDGSLRLVRNGPVFATYYRDRHNPAWLCSGAMLVQRMADDVYIRLAAKHWAKGVVPPENHVTFRDFRIFQF